MWIVKYIACLIHGHEFAAVRCQGVDNQHEYAYCLRCGSTEHRGTMAGGHVTR